MDPITAWILTAAPTVVSYMAAAIVGALVAYGELLTLYQTTPLAALTNRWTVAYLLINGAASMAALFLIQRAGFSIGPDRALDPVAAGLGAMALLRAGFVLPLPSTGSITNRKTTISLYVLLEHYLNRVKTEINQTVRRALEEEVYRLVDSLSVEEIANLCAVCSLLEDAERKKRRTPAQVSEMQQKVREVPNLISPSETVQKRAAGIILVGEFDLDLLVRAVRMVSNPS